MKKVLILALSLILSPFLIAAISFAFFQLDIYALLLDTVFNPYSFFILSFITLSIVTISILVSPIKRKIAFFSALIGVGWALLFGGFWSIDFAMSVYHPEISKEIAFQAFGLAITNWNIYALYWWFMGVGLFLSTVGFYYYASYKRKEEKWIAIALAGILSILFGFIIIIWILWLPPTNPESTLWILRSFGGKELVLYAYNFIVWSLVLILMGITTALLNSFLAGYVQRRLK